MDVKEENLDELLEKAELEAAGDEQWKKFVGFRQ